MKGRLDNLDSNLEALERFWRRAAFHDRVIESITAINRRVLIRVQDHTLVITGVTALERCELPTVWLYEKLARSVNGFALEISTEPGTLRVSGADLRLIRNDD